MKVNNFIFLCYIILFIKNKKVIFLYFFIQTIPSFLLLIPLILTYTTNFYLSTINILIILRLVIKLNIYIYIYIYIYRLNYNFYFFSIQKIIPFILIPFLIILYIYINYLS